MAFITLGLFSVRMAILSRFSNRTASSEDIIEIWLGVVGASGAWLDPTDHVHLYRNAATLTFA
jgi:hypothetical protein